MKQINIPDNWNEVSISQYQQIADIKESENKAVKIIAILAAEKEEDVMLYDLHSINKVYSALAWIEKMPDSANYKPIIEIDEEKYGFINRLSDLSLGEWIDLEYYLMDIPKNMHKIFSVLYRPLVAATNDRHRTIYQYNTGEALQRSEIFKAKMNVGDVYGALVFFCLIERECIKSLRSYFLKERANKMTKAIRCLGGLISRIVFPKAISQRWAMYLKRTLNSVSASRYLNKATGL
jgi:hypothetical protein